MRGELPLTPLLLLLSPFSPTASPSINLCQLLPRAKPCLRETDLKGPIKSGGLHCEVSAPPPTLAGPVSAALQRGSRRDTESTGLKGREFILEVLTLTYSGLSEHRWGFLRLHSQDLNQFPQKLSWKIVDKNMR